MRKVTFGAACSLDGYIARLDGGVDWLMWNSEVSEIMATYWKTIDTVVMGRKTYEAALKIGGGGGGNPYRGVRTYVVSRTLEAGPAGGVEVISGDAAAFVRGLKEQSGKDICLMGGGELGRTLLEAGLVDEVGVNIHPVLLGSGVPLFPPRNSPTGLVLAESRVLKNGCVYLLYRVPKPAA